MQIRSRNETSDEEAAIPKELSSSEIRDIKSYKPGTCPKQRLDYIVYNHISKTGGTPMKELLRETFDETGNAAPDWKLRNNNSMEMLIETDTDWYDGKTLPNAKTRHGYVLGVVRRPCDYLLSTYKEKYPHGLDPEGEVKTLEMYVNDIMNPPPGYEVMKPYALMSKALLQRYGSTDKVHCMVREHNLKADFTACMQQFENCGGVVYSPPTDEVLEKALARAQKAAVESGRSVSGQSKCAKVFTPELISLVLKTEQTVIDKFDLGQCCSQ